MPAGERCSRMAPGPPLSSFPHPSHIPFSLTIPIATKQDKMGILGVGWTALGFCTFVAFVSVRLGDRGQGAGGVERGRRRAGR